MEMIVEHLQGRASLFSDIAPIRLMVEEIVGSFSTQEVTIRRDSEIVSILRIAHVTDQGIRHWPRQPEQSFRLEPIFSLRDKCFMALSESPRI